MPAVKRESSRTRRLRRVHPRFCSFRSVGDGVGPVIWRDDLGFDTGVFSEQAEQLSTVE
jgi:hypothetical protein